MRGCSGGRGLGVGACVVAPGGGVCGCSGGCMVSLGTCMVAPGGEWLLPGGVHAWLLGGCVVSLGGVRGCSQGGTCMGYDVIHRYGQ